MRLSPRRHFLPPQHNVLPQLSTWLLLPFPAIAKPCLFDFQLRLLAGDLRCNPPDFLLLVVYEGFLHSRKDRALSVARWERGNCEDVDWLNVVWLYSDDHLLGTGRCNHGKG